MLVNNQFTPIVAADLCINDRFVLSAHSLATAESCEKAFGIEDRDTYITVFTSEDRLKRLVLPKARVIFLFTPPPDTTPRVEYRAIVQMIAVRSTIILNLRRLQQGKEPKAVTNGMINPDGVALWSDKQSLIDPAIHVLAKLRFPVTLTAEQGKAIDEAMRDYFHFSAVMYTYATMRNAGKPAAQVDDMGIYETLYQLMSKSE